MPLHLEYTYQCDICGVAMPSERYEIPYSDSVLPHPRRDAFRFGMIACDPCANALNKIVRAGIADLRGEMGGLHRLAAEVVADPPGKA